MWASRLAVRISPEPGRSKYSTTKWGMALPRVCRSDAMTLSRSPSQSMEPAMADDPLIARLMALDVCAVSDALDRLKLAPSASGLSPQTVRARIAGRASTVKFAAGSRAGARHACTAAIEAAGPGGIVV